MKASSAWERKRCFADFAPSGLDTSLEFTKVSRVNHHEQMLGRRGLVGGKASREAAVKKTGVGRTIVLEFPSEYSLIERLGPRDVGCRNFNIVDLFFRF